MRSHLPVMFVEDQSSHTSSPGAEGGPVCKKCPLILTLDPCRGPKGALKKPGCHFHIWVKKL